MILPRQGQRVQVGRDITISDLYAENPGDKGEMIILVKGLEGRVIDIHKKDNAPSRHVCVDFTLSGVVGCWYIDVADLEWEE
jgi:hypothetical protein